MSPEQIYEELRKLQEAGASKQQNLLGTAVSKNFPPTQTTGSQYLTGGLNKQIDNAFQALENLKATHQAYNDKLKSLIRPMPICPEEKFQGEKASVCSELEHKVIMLTEDMIKLNKKFGELLELIAL